MRGAVSLSAVARAALSGIALLAVGYLAVLALNPRLREGLWPSVQWFGRPGSWPTIAIVTVVLVALGALLFQSHGVQRPGAPVAIVAGLAIMSLILGLASYWRCHDANHPWFFTPLIWAANVLKGSIEDRALNGQTCPTPPLLAQVIAGQLVFRFAVDRGGQRCDLLPKRWVAKIPRRIAADIDEKRFGGQ